MRSRWVLFAAALLGCASGGDEDATTTASDASVSDTRVDTGVFVPGDGPMEAIFPVDDAELPPKLCDTPKGTTATASASYETSTPEKAVDRELGSYWNSGSNTGWLKLKFPSPVVFDRVRIAAHALPVSNETYHVSGFKGGSGGKIGSAVRPVPGATAWLAPIDVTPGAYDEIMIEIGMSDSWITAAEVRVFDSTGGCSVP